MKQIKHPNIWFLAFLASFILFTFHWDFNSYADENKELEYTIKASFLIKIINFIEWPYKSDGKYSRTSEIILCLSGKDPFGNILELASKEGFIMENLIIKRNVAPLDMKKCHVLFISSSEKDRLKDILKEIEGYPILVVGDTKGFAKKGVGLNFVTKKNRIRFEINQRAVEKKGIKINSELLNLAIIVNAVDSNEIVQ